MAGTAVVCALSDACNRCMQEHFHVVQVARTRRAAAGSHFWQGAGDDQRRQQQQQQRGAS